MFTQFAKRAYARIHDGRFDPIIRSLLNTDLYKLVMLQFIWLLFPTVRVTFALINRKKSVRIADTVNRYELVRQLDHTRGLSFQKDELAWMETTLFYGMRNVFRRDFLEWLADFRLGGYRLEEKDGQWELVFEGTWLQTTMWEIYALAIVNELRTRAALAKLSELELEVLYERAKAKLWSKIERLRGVPGLSFSDFGTRRRHSFLWQEYVVLMMKAELGDAFVGTSNAYLAFKHGLNAVGTNAHELPMTLAALARQGLLGEVTLKQSQYEVLRLWKQVYQGGFLVILPDTFGSTQFFRDAPKWVAEEYGGVRLDSKDPYLGGDEVIEFFASNGQDPTKKLLIPSDGLDVGDILGLHAHFGGTISESVRGHEFHDARDFLDTENWTQAPRIRDSEGWGTMATNDFLGCHPRGLDDLDAISLVCKVREVEGHPAVKLSDNYNKATGPAHEVEIYRDTFGSEGMHGAPVTT